MCVVLVVLIVAQTGGLSVRVILLFIIWFMAKFMAEFFQLRIKIASSKVTNAATSVKSQITHMLFGLIWPFCSSTSSKTQ
jgi:Na+-transporting methylmalonyl-CoA/oxaloacetate decarboxylase gamma subunit